MGSIGFALILLGVVVGMASGIPHAQMLKHRRPGAPAPRRAFDWDDAELLASRRDRYTAEGLRLRRLALAGRWSALVLVVIGVLVVALW